MRGEVEGQRRSRTLVFPLLGIGVLSAVSLAGTLLAPALATSHPLVLVALSPRLLFMAWAARGGGFVAFVSVAGLRSAIGDPFHFVLGRRGAVAVASRSGAAARAFGRAEQFVKAWGLVAVAVRPVGVVLAAAGAAGLDPRRVAVADAAGTLVQVVALYEGARALTAMAGVTTAVELGIGLLLGAGTVAAVARRRPSPATAPARHPSAAVAWLGAP